MRISSTQLNTFSDCPTRWYKEYVAGEQGNFGRAASIGSLFHSIIEFRIMHGYEPTRSMLCKLKGNYDDPLDHLRRYPTAWEPALEMARHIEDPMSYIPADYELVGVEVCLDDLGVEIEPGVLCGGYFDLLARNAEGTEYWIGDWKTRGKASWKKRPSTDEDFAENIQFTYYAAALAQAFPSVEKVHVTHINMLRPADGGPAVKEDGATFTRLFLESVWTDLKTGVVASMIQMVEAGEQPDPPTDTSPCWKYGRCPHLRACTARRQDIMFGVEDEADSGGGFFESFNTDKPKNSGFFGSFNGE